MTLATKKHLLVQTWVFTMCIIKGSCIGCMLSASSRQWFASSHSIAICVFWVWWENKFVGMRHMNLLLTGIHHIEPIHHNPMWQIFNWKASFEYINNFSPGFFITLFWFLAGCYTGDGLKHSENLAGPNFEPCPAQERSGFPSRWITIFPCIWNAHLTGNIQNGIKHLNRLPCGMNVWDFLHM